MIKKIFIFGLLSFMTIDMPLSAHCQMPCGIYHDDMVYDQIDQYIETMYKCMAILKNNEFASIKDRNEFIRWVCEKEKESNDVAHLITEYFLQQKIKPGEADTDKRIRSAHKLLFLAMKMKQGFERSIVEEFDDEWDKFKLMFHVEGYECQIEMIKMRKREVELQKQKETEGDPSKIKN